MSWRRILAGIGLAGIAACSTADDDFMPAWRAITQDEIARHVAVLASDEFEGRAPGTPGEEKTLRYLEDAFREAGAQPGFGSSYLQPVPLVELRRTGTPRFEIAGVRSESFAFKDDFVVFAGRPVEEVRLSGLPVYFAGFGVSAEEFEWDDYRGAGLEGAVVILLRGEPSSAADSTFFRGRAVTRHALPQTKYDLAARHGARAAIVVHTDSSAGYPWSVMTGGGVGTTQNFLEEDPDDPKLDLVVQINEPAARRLFARGGLDFDHLVQRANQPGFTAVRTPLAARLECDAEVRRITSHNVVAHIPGRDRSAECVLYTGHWDHVGRNDDLEGDTIFNGAVDNATGTAGLLALARAFASLPRPPRRSVYLVATTAEEKGLLGAEYLARNPIVPLERTIAVLNLDALFPFGDYDAMTVTGFGSSEIEDVMAIASRRLNRVLQDDSSPEVGAYYRSDHYPFAKRGVPAVFAVGNPRNDVEPDSALMNRFGDYLANGYHKTGDEYDPETWDLRGVEGDIRIYFETGWRIAESDGYPNWRDGNEFRGLRDRMRAAPRPEP